LITIFLLAAVSCASWLVFVYLPSGWHVEKEAAAALFAALLGVAATEFTHNILFRSSIQACFGEVLLVLSIVASFAAIARPPQSLSADALVALTATGLGVAGTFFGHAKGRKLGEARQGTNRADGV